MPYYGGRGDYYRGDYYRGDLWGTIKGTIGGLATGGLGGAVKGFTDSLKKPNKGAPPPPPSGGIYDLPVAGPVARGIKQLASGKGGHRRPRKGEPGYRPRRMNPLNVKALRRADRRARSFLRITRSVVRHYTAKQPKGRSYVKASRRRK